MARSHKPNSGHTPSKQQGNKAQKTLISKVGGSFFKRRAVAWLIQQSKIRICARENLRYETTRLFGRLREIFKELGLRLSLTGALESPGDIYYLTADDVLDFIEGRSPSTDLKALITLRKTDFQAYKGESLPNRFTLTGMLGLLGDLQDQDHMSKEQGDTRAGMGCSSGTARGRVRIIDEVRQSDLQPGEILVARYSDPGMVTLFLMAQGALFELGNPLSHTAIVARELGLPMVVSIPGLLDWLCDGDEIELDGKGGQVRKITRD